MGGPNPRAAHEQDTKKILSWLDFYSIRGSRLGSGVFSNTVALGL